MANNFSTNVNSTRQSRFDRPAASEKLIEPEKPKSLIWKYFTFESSYNFSRCLNCKYQLPGSDTNQLKEHLREHREVYREFKDARKLKHSNQDKEAAEGVRETKYSEELTRLKRVKQESRDEEQKTSNGSSTIRNKSQKGAEHPMNAAQNAMEVELSLFMSAGNIGISGLQFPPFKRLLNKFRPDFSLPSNSFDLDHFLDNTYTNILNKMKEILAFVRKFTLMISAIPLINDPEMSALCISIGFKLNGQFETMLLGVCDFDANTSKAVCNLQPIVEKTMERYKLESNQVINTFLSGFEEAGIMKSRILMFLPHTHQKQILDILGMEIHGYVSWTQNINHMERNAIVRLNKKFSNYTAPPPIPVDDQKIVAQKAPVVENPELSRSAESPKRPKGFEPGRRFTEIKQSTTQEKISPGRRSSSPGRESPNCKLLYRRRSKRSMSKDSRSPSPQSKIPRKILNNFPTAVITLCQVSEHHFTCERIFNLMSSYGHVLRIKFLEKRQETCMVEFQRIEHANVLYEFMNRLHIFGKIITIKPSRSKKIIHDEIFSFTLPNGDISSAEYPRLKTPPKIHEDISYPCNTLQFSNAPPEMTAHELRKRLEHRVPNASLPIRIGQQNDVNELRGFMEFDNSEHAAEAIAYFNNLHFRSSYNLQLRFWSKDPGDGIFWTN